MVFIVWRSGIYYINNTLYYICHIHVTFVSHSCFIRHWARFFSGEANMLVLIQKMESD